MSWYSRIRNEASDANDRAENLEISLKDKTDALEQETTKREELERKVRFPALKNFNILCSSFKMNNFANQTTKQEEFERKIRFPALKILNILRSSFEMNDFANYKQVAIYK